MTKSPQVWETEELNYKEVVHEAFERDNDGPLTLWKPFNEVNVMVITALGIFDHPLDSIKPLVKLLPVTRPHLQRRSRNVKKIPLEWPGQPNVIMSCCLGNERRGIVRSNSENGWRHAVMIDISTSEKNVNCKISRSNIHMTGCKSVEMAQECTQIIIDHINQIGLWVEILQFMLEDSPERVHQIISEVFSDGIIEPQQDPFDENKIQDWDVHMLKSRENDTSDDAVIRKLCFNALSDIRTQVEAKVVLEWLPTVKPFNSKHLGPATIDSNMIKRRFNLKIPLDLNNLVRYVHADFHRDYYSDVRNYARVEILCKRQKVNKKKKQEINKHTFNIESNGRVTMSTSVLEEMEEIYYRFLYELFNILDLIRTDIE
jgi:hypothetical protein